MKSSWHAMLSSVLNSDRAIEVNIEVMRTFVRLRMPRKTGAICSERPTASRIEPMVSRCTPMGMS